MTDQETTNGDSMEKQLPPAPVESSSATTWKLPDGIEDHLYEGLIKTAAGAVVGGVAGAIIFKSGGGWRGASAAMGIGAGLGSTIERAIADPRVMK